MDPPQHFLHHKRFIIDFFLIILNLLLLDIFVVTNFRNIISKQQATQNKNTVMTAQTQTNNPVCPKECLLAIDSINKQDNTSTFSAAILPSEEGVKELFIPLGSGTTSIDDWTDVPGLSVSIDSSKYARIKKAVFEATTHVPNANEIVYVRLYNQTSQHQVYNSELTFPSGETPTLAVSSPITFDAGAKVYKVQMKTQFRFPAYLDQARIHITLN